jgi:4-amino-4-deoxy-L-arabinose transferase-like glycosyltransferase
MPPVQPAQRIPSETRSSGPILWLVIALSMVYLFAGLFGHDPWKSEDAINLAIAHDFSTGGAWLTPTLAGEPWPEAEPLYHWLAAASGSAVSPFHEGARLASALFGSLFLAFLSATARRLYGVAAGWGAPLLAIGTLGLLVPMHEAQPVAAVLATAACVYWGAALLADRPLAGALLMGGGLGSGFLAGGLNEILPLLALLAFPLLHRQWMALGVTLAIALIIGGAWPALLAWQDPAFLSAWWSAELATLAPRGGLTIDHLQWLGWFAWPVLFIAPWALWRGRHKITAAPLGLPLLGAASGLVWFLIHEPKIPATLPLLPPLMLLAATGTERLRRGAANAWDWFGMMTFTIVAGLIWLGASAMLAGWPPKIAHNFAKLAPGFVARFSWPALLVALVATVVWLLVVWRLPRSPWRVASRWAVGVTVIWVLAVALLMPWIDYGKTYRPVVAELRRALPADVGCLGRRGLGAPQRAALDYFAGIRTRAGSKNCDWLIVQSSQQEVVPAGWHKVWEGHRPGDRNEWLRLYRHK